MKPYRYTAALTIASGLVLILILIQTSRHFITRTDNISDAHTIESTSSSCAPAPSSSQVINVMTKGAKGDGMTDDTAAIQSAIDSIDFGGTVLVPNGTYLINGLSNDWDGLILKSNMTLKLTNGAVLKEIPNTATSSSVIGIQDVSNVNIIGGTVQGERYEHTGPISETGMGININSAHNVVVEGVTTKDAWGDGIYIGGVAVPSTNITICNVVSDNNRRQGLSVTSANGVVIKYSTFRNTNGALPEAGIDIEPDSGAPYVKNIKILNSQFTNNAGNQILIYAGDEYQGIKPVSGVIIDGNNLNSENIGIGLRNLDDVKITNNHIATQKMAIEFNKSKGNILSGNTVLLR